MKKILVVFAILFIVMSGSVYAKESERYLWMNSSSTAGYYLDTGAVAWTKEHYIDVWFKVVYTPEEAQRKFPERDLSFSLQHVQIALDPDRWRILSEYYYNSNDESIFNYNHSTQKVAWDEIIPSSQAELWTVKVINFIANNKDKVNQM